MILIHDVSLNTLAASRVHALAWMALFQPTMDDVNYRVPVLSGRIVGHASIRQCAQMVFANARTNIDH